MAELEDDGQPGGAGMLPVEQFLDEVDERIASRQRIKLGRERKLVSWTRLPSGRFRACLSVDRLKRMRFVRDGTTRVRAVENANRAYTDLLRLLMNRATYQNRFPEWPAEE